MSAIQPTIHWAGQLQRKSWLLALLLLAALPTWASDYYWVGGNGQWNDLSHWSPSSGGAATYPQVPQSTDNVYFDAKSFSASNQTVNFGGIVTCLNLDWTGAVRAGVSGMRFTGSGTLEVNGDLHLTAGLGRQDVNFRLLATSTSHALDLQAVPVNGWLSLESETGGWVCSSDLNLVQYGATPSLLLMAGRIDFGTATVSCYGVRSTGNMVRSISLNAATFNLLAAVNAWEVSGTRLQLQAGTSTLRLGGTAQRTANSYAFNSTAQTYNVVEVAAGASATINAANSSFGTLAINGLATLTSAATITSTLSVGRDAVLRAAAGQVLTLGPLARLALTSSCVGLAHVQSSVPGQAATIQAAAGWNGIVLNYVVLQDVALTGGGTAQADNSLDRGNNAGVTFTALPVSDLYWVGGSGNWHDAAHWSQTSGGPATSGGCLPTLATNVHFDVKSFTGAGQVVTLDGANGFCRDLDFTGASAPVFSTAAADLGQHQLGIGGSLTLVAGVSFTAKADLVFYGHEAGVPAATVATAGQALAGNVYFRAAGSTYTLLDGLTLTPGATSPNGRLYVEAGTLLTNSQPVTCQGFTSGYAATGSVFTTGTAAGGPVSAAAVAVNLGASILNLTPASALSDVGLRPTYTWDVAPGVALTAATSTIRIGSNATHNQAAVFRAGLGLQYNAVFFTDPAALSLPTVVPGSAVNATFGQLSFAGSANVSASNTFTDQLVLAAGRIYNFYNSTQSFTASGQLAVAGDCSGFVYINGGTGTARVKFSKPAGGTLNALVLFAVLRNATFQGGATWASSQCIDGGGNAGIAFTNPILPRTLYWVGGTGNWTDANHWALSSGGAAGVCVPNQLDAAVFDNLSFTAINQVVTQDAVLATCRSLNWAAATFVPTFSGPDTNTLAVYGSLTWAPAMRQLLQGDVQLLGGGTLTSNGQSFGGGLVLNAPGATISLADALNQPRTSGAGLTQTTGTLLTNGQPLVLRSLSSAPPDGDANPPARALRLGTSIVEITAGAWAPTDPTTLTLEAAAATIYLSTGTTFAGNNFAYNVVQTGASASHTLTGNNTIGTLELAGINQVAGSNAIGQQLTLDAGTICRFGAGTTTAFAATATVQAAGTGTSVITLQSTINNQAFIWSKPAGTVCASYIYLRDSQAQGGAYFEAGQQANNQGNTSGWSFGTLPQAVYASQRVCPQLGAHYLRFAFSGLDRFTQQPIALAAAQYPLTLVLLNLTTGSTSTISVTGPTYDHLVPDSQNTYQYQVLSLATSSTGCTPLVNTGATTPFPVVTDGPLNGSAGQWTGATASWLDCQNWADGTVPTAATDVTIGPAANAPVLNGPVVLGSLHVLTGGQLTLGSAAELTVSSHWLNEGTTTVDDASLVTFGGSSTQQVLSGHFGRVVLSNPAGLSLLSDASSSTSLALTAGIITTGSYQWVHTSAVAGSIGSGSAGSYVAGRLRRTLAPGSSDTYTFPVGTASQYAPLDLLSSQLVGTNTIEASFAPKTDSDVGLNCVDTTPSALRYVAVQAAGRWLLVPDAQPTGGTYAVRVSLAPFSGLTDNLFGILKRPDASASAADWNTGGGLLSAAGGAGRLVADGYALRSGLSSFSQFGLGQAVANTPLPVTLVSFQVAAQGAAAQLGWTVAQELNLSGYAVERSRDGRSFQPVGEVAALGGLRRTYAFTDAQAREAAAGQPLYYRLRLLEPGAPDAFSTTVVVRFAEASGGLLAWPTRFTTTLHVDAGALGSTLRQVELLDGQGRVVFGQALPTGSTTATFAVPTLAAGLYVLRTTTATGTCHQRLVRE